MKNYDDFDQLLDDKLAVVAAQHACGADGKDPLTTVDGAENWEKYLPEAKRAAAMFHVFIQAYHDIFEKR